MYARKLSIYDFRCFGKTVLDLQYPGKRGRDASPLANVNLVLGDNGGGKSSILRALAVALLAPVLIESGWIPYRMVRRPGAEKALLKVGAVLESYEVAEQTAGKTKNLDILARFDLREGQSRDRLHLESTPTTPISAGLFDDESAAFFMVGYGATRRVESGDYTESSHRRSRGVRYQRVAGLFEDHVALRPVQSWLLQLPGFRRDEILRLLNRVLPPDVRFHGDFDSKELQFLVDFNGRATPFASLSDGYKAFVGMVGDMLGHLAEVSDGRPLDAIPGVVLVDEIDLHLHPSWQNSVLTDLANTFPRLQFVCTSHSPLVAGTVQKENVFVTDVDDNGLAIVKQIEERVFGQSAEEILLSSYFGLSTTRSERFRTETDQLLSKAVSGDKRAALEFLDQLTRGEDPETNGRRGGRAK